MNKFKQFVQLVQDQRYKKRILIIINSWNQKLHFTMESLILAQDER